MSVPPESLDTAAPRDPAAYRAPRMMGPGFWAMIAFSVLCVIGGAAIVLIAPRLLGKPAPSAVVEPLPVVTSVPPGPEAPSAVVVTPPAQVQTSAEIGELQDRLSALEARESRMAEAAASALAAAALVEASQGSRPFPDELRSLESVSPPSAELRALRRPAELGAPSRAALASSFPDYAARAAAAGRTPAEGATMMARVSYALSRVVSLRRVGEVKGDGVDATLARAERMVEDGELDQALRTLDGLPPASRESLSAWRARAERRAEIDRRVTAVRTEALETLARISRGSGT